MVNMVDLIIRTKVEGLGEVGQLRKELQDIRNEDLKSSRTSDVATRKVQERTNAIARENLELKDISKVGAEHRINMGMEVNLNKERRLQLANFNEVNQRAAQLFEKNNMTQEQAIKQAEKEIAAEHASAIAKEKKNAELQKEAALRGKVRAQLMQQSIGMFVLGITATQTLSVMSEMVGKNTMLGKTFTAMAGAVRMMLGPIQVYIALLQLMAAENKKVLISSLPIMFTLGGIFLIFKAFSEQAPGVRAAMGALAAGLLVMAAASKILTAQQYAEGISSIFKWVTRSGPLAPAMAAVILTAVGAAIAGAAVLYATAPKGQTLPGYARPVTETGLFYAHRGEMVGRVGNMEPMMESNRTNITINIESGAVIDDSLISKLARQVELSVASGQGV